jgi:F-type H+-transporting ATPase subunit a
MAASELETVFSIARFHVPNTLLATLVVDAVILALVFAIRRRLSLVPGKLQGAAEGLVDYLYTTTEQVSGSRAPLIFPWVAVFFIYVALSNFIGLFPGFGTIGFWRNGELVPLLHASTSDLNLTLALAIVSVIATNVLAIRTTGIRRYLLRWFPLGPLLFVGLLELLLEFVKFITFSFRLYGNISAGERVLGTMAKLAAFIVPVPFLALEMLVAVIQGLIFALLTMAFMTILTETHAGTEGEKK